MDLKESFYLATYRGKLPMKGTSVPNKKSTKAQSISVSRKLKSPITGHATKIYHASRGKTAPKLTAFSK